MRWTMTKKQKISFRCLFFLLSALLAVSGFMAYKELSGRQKEKEDFAELAELVQANPSEILLPDEPGQPADGEEAGQSMGGTLPHCLHRMVNASAGSASPARGWTIL